MGTRQHRVALPKRDEVLAVPVTLVPGFRVVGAPETLFEGPYRANANRTLLDLDRDAERLLMVKEPLEAVLNRQIHLVLNWFEELKQRVPPGAR